MLSKWDLLGFVNMLMLVKFPAADLLYFALLFSIFQQSHVFSAKPQIKTAILTIEVLSLLATALEHRNSPSESTLDIREAYFAYYPNWGEIKIGKQIHAWGAADGNNPTDNINAYDYYYLFDQKQLFQTRGQTVSSRYRYSYG